MSTDPAMLWIALVVVWPLLSGSLCFIWPQRTRALGVFAALTTGLLGLSVWALPLQDWALGGWASPLGIGWRLDVMAQGFIVMTALIGALLSLYAAFDKHLPKGFWPLWLGAWGAMNALYLSADVFNVYVTLELLGLSAVALVALAGQAASVAAALRYLLVSLLGSMLFLLAVALLYAHYSSLDMRALAQVMEPSLLMTLALALMSAGLLAKTALFPLHSWLPLAHGRALPVVSAILSALVIKASFYLLARLWLEVFAPLQTLALVYFWLWLGALAVVWGAWQAITASRLKALVAWSTVAQVGYLVIGLALLAHPSVPVELASVLLLLVVAHALAKAAMFLAAGNVYYQLGDDAMARIADGFRALPRSLFAFALAGVSLAGLPISAGFLAKWFLLEQAVSLQLFWLVAVLLLGSLLTAGYVFRVLNLAFLQASPSEDKPLFSKVSTAQEVVALCLALGAILLGFSGSFFYA